MSEIFKCPSCGSILTGRVGGTLKCPRCGNPVSNPASDSGTPKLSRQHVARRVTGLMQFLAANKVGVVSAITILISGMLIVLASQAGGDPEDSNQASTSSNPSSSDTATDKRTAPRDEPAEETRPADVLVAMDDMPGEDDGEPSPVTKNEAVESLTDPTTTTDEPARGTSKRVGTDELATTPAKPRTDRPKEAANTTPTPSAKSARRDSVGDSVVPNWPSLETVTNGARWPYPKLSDATFTRWSDFIRPTEEELAWRKVRWHTELAVAAREAQELQRPILLWTMNGHPCGET